MIATVTLAAVVSAASPRAAALSELERQRLVAHLEMTSAWLADELADLTPSQAQFRPGANAWTIAEVLEHLVLVEDVYWQDLQSALKQPPAKGSAMTDADVLWYGIDRTRKEQAIAGERPAGQLRVLKEGLQTYRTRHDRFLQFVKTTREDLRGHLVPRQSCDAYQWALLISTHEQRHILQIREIKRDPRFPKK
jgi:hypothetical protein